MNDYKELIKKSLEALSYAEQINPNIFYLTRADLKIIADAIEQLVKERDAAIKDIGWNCIKCKRYDEASPNYGYTEECKNCGTYPWFDDEAESKWEWRGVTK